MVRIYGDEEEASNYGSNVSNHDKIENNNIETQSSHGKVLEASSSERKKELSCKFCTKKFTNSQALGGHQNAHKEARAAAKKEKILSLASAYKDSSLGYPNQANYGLGSKTIAVQLQPLSLTHNNNHPHYNRPYMPHDSYPHHHHDLWPQGNHIMNRSQPTLHLFQTLMADRTGFHPPHKSDQSLFFPTLQQNLGSQPQLLNPSLCNNGQVSNSSIEPQNGSIEWPNDNLSLKIVRSSENFDEASNSSTTTQAQNASVEGHDLGDNENFDQARGSSSNLEKGTQDDEIDLTLRL